MSTPICHRLMSIPITYTDGDGSVCTEMNLITGHARCIGSRCALWEQRTFPDDDAVPLGVCADNLRREPWPDPAAKETP